jgi:hypothetical protein
MRHHTATQKAVEDQDDVARRIDIRIAQVPWVIERFNVELQGNGPFTEGGGLCGYT